jgi:short-subunit dehydrogenase involved in D-alanine esterification of teichoic acids
MIVAVAYGLNVQPDNDPYINTSEEAIHMITKTLGSNLVDVLPILKHVPEWVPGAGFQTRARDAKRVARRILENPYKVAKDRIVRAFL